MPTFHELVHGVRNAARDAGVRTGLLPYRPLRWSPGRWEQSYSSRDTDSYGELNEVARYGVLLSYLSWIGPDVSVLDVGCGAGLLRTRVPEASFRTYVGVDPTRAAIDLAGSLVDERTSFVHGDPMDTDLGRHDVVVCSEVLYFSPRPEALVERLGTFVRPGGHLLFSVWRHPGDTALWGWIDGRYDRLDRVTVRNPGNRFAPRGWQVGCYRTRQRT